VLHDETFKIFDRTDELASLSVFENILVSGALRNPPHLNVEASLQLFHNVHLVLQFALCRVAGCMALLRCLGRQMAETGVWCE